jgi:hypothetical protein
MTEIRQYAAVIFDKSTCATSEIYEEYYKKNFEGKTFIFLGEIPNVPGHCLIADLYTGEVSGMHHTDNFREATEEEV